MAIKKFKATDDDDKFARTALREVKILRSMRHMNIVEMFDAFKRYLSSPWVPFNILRKGKLFLVFEFVDKNLLEVLRDCYPSGFDPALLQSTVSQIIRGIEFCHRQHVVHRDMKPENILMNLSDKSVKICDFGLARSLPHDTRGPLTDYVATRWYRAPELLIGDLNYGTAVDIFAIGCVMAELADGDPLLPGDSELAQIYLISKVIGPFPTDMLQAETLNLLSDPSSSPEQVEDRSPVLDLDERYLTRLSLKCIRFLRQLLALDPKRRTTAASALLDPYLASHFSRSASFVAKGHNAFSLPCKLSLH